MPAECCKKFWARIPDDVPVFTIVGWDVLAVETLAEWIALAIKAGVNPAKLQAAEAHLAAIQVYQAAHPERCKVPD